MSWDARYEPVYRAFAAFCERCLVEDRSLLWPEQEIWTITNLEHARRRFVEGFIQGGLTFRDKLETQLSGAPPEVWALLADCFYVYGLPSRSIRFETRQAWIAWAAGQAGLALPASEGEAESGLWEGLRAGFATTGQKYNLKHAQLRLLILLALEVKAAPERKELLASPERLQALLDGILSGIPLRLDRANDMRNAILFMSFPDSYEPILSNRDKDAILQHYRERGKKRVPPESASTAAPADRDAALRQVREALAPRFKDRKTPFDFYHDLREEWRPNTAEIEKTIAAQIREPSAVRERREEDWLARVEKEDDPDVRRILAALRLTRNVILYGPPGTGKTYLAQKAAIRLAETASYRPGSPVWWVTLHPSYTYEDFVEGLRPALPAASEASGSESESSRLVYEVRPGVFREVCQRAGENPDRIHVLVLDEINRANLAKILGELITLIEDDKRGALSARLPYSGAMLTVPPNLVLLGTMNTADRSIALLDTALRRRFAFVEIPPRPEMLAGAVVETEEAVLHLDDLLRCINAAIVRHLGRDHQIGHSYFLRVAQEVGKDRPAVLELVWNHQILPLLVEYFYSRRDALADILAPFLDETQPEDVTADAAAFARLSGEDLVVALSRLCA